MLETVLSRVQTYSLFSADEEVTEKEADTVKNFVNALLNVNELALMEQTAVFQKNNQFAKRVLNKIEEGKKAGHTMLRLAVASGVIGGLIVLILIPFVLDYAMLTDQALKYLKFMLFVNVYYITGTSVNTTLIAGVFRAGGDSKFGFVCDTIDMWCYAVPLGFFAAFVLKLPVEAVYFLLCTDEFVKWPWVFKRFYSYKWAKNITRDNIDTIEETAVQV